MFKRVVIFDGNHLAYRAFYKFMNLKTLDGVKTSVIYGMPYVAESLIRRLGPDKVVVVFDGGRSSFRMGLLPSYKAREQKLGFDKDDFYRQKDEGMKLFQALGLQVVWKKYTEADDLIAMLTRRFRANGWESVIVSADKDFNQLISPEDLGVVGGISIFNVKHGQLITYENYQKYLEYSPEQCVDYLSVTGDKSDHIDGYPGLGNVRTLDLLSRYGNINSFLESGDKFGKVDKVKLKEIWQRNKKLIDLKYFYRKFMMKEAIPYLNLDATLDMNALKKICGQYEINSFLKPQFLNTFKNISNG